MKIEVKEQVMRYEPVNSIGSDVLALAKAFCENRHKLDAVEGRTIAHLLMMASKTVLYFPKEIPCRKR